MAATINADNGVVSGSAGLKSSADSSGVLALQTNGTVALTVDTSQNVGIGATTAALGPATGRIYLAIKGTGTAANTGTGVLQLQTNAAGSTTPLIGNIEWSIPDNTASTGTRVAFITSSAEGTTANNVGSLIYFATKTDGVSGTGTERMRIDSSGRVLIGNTSTYSFSGISPNLQVTDDSITNVDADGGTLALFGNSAFAINSGAGLAFGYTYNTGLYVSGARVRGAKENATAGNYAGYLGFDTRANGGNFTEKMRIDSAGNVGIGTTTPDIYSQGGKMFTVSNTATNSYSWLTLVGSGTGGGEVDFGNQTIRHAAIASLNGSSLAFYTNSTNSGAAVTQRMTITSGGAVGIGTNSPTAGYTLDVAGNLTVSTGIAYINTSSAGTALTVRSNSAGGSQGGQIAMTNTWPSATNPNKYMRVDDAGNWSLVNSGYSQGIFSVTDAGVANAYGGYQKNGTTISSIVYADVSITGLTTSFQEKLFTLPNSITYTSVVCIIPLNGVNDIVSIDYISLGEWSGVQLTTQARVGIKLGNAVASTTGNIRVYYRI